MNILMLKHHLEQLYHTYVTMLQCLSSNNHVTTDVAQTIIDIPGAEKQSGETMNIIHRLHTY